MTQTTAHAHAAGNNDNATRRVPDSEKKSTLSVAMVTAGYCICMSGLFTGASMAAGMSLRNAIIASIIGNLILSVYGCAVGVAGAKEGVSTSILARHSFGRNGSKIIGVLLAVVMLGWFSVQVGFFGDTIHAMFPNAGFITNKYFAAFWGGILMLLTAYFGYKGLNILSYIAVPLIALIATIGVIVAVNQAGGWGVLQTMQPAATVSIGGAIVMVVGSFAGGAAAQADITRYAKTPKVAVIATIIGYMIANMFIIIAGYICTVATGIGDLPAAMLSLGLGFPALVILIMAQWTTNDNNLYTSSLGLSNTLNIPKKKITLVAGILATIVGAAGLSNYFDTWLNIIGIGLPPMAGIILADYYFVKHQKYEYGPGTRYNSWNLLAFLSWAIACVVGYTVTWGVASINSLVVGLVLYIILMKTAGKDGHTGMVGTCIEEDD